MIPQPHEIWSDAGSFIARVEGVWPASWTPPGPPWPQVAYRRKTGGPLVNMRLDRFLNRFSRIPSKPTGPFE